MLAPILERQAFKLIRTIYTHTAINAYSLFTFWRHYLYLLQYYHLRTQKLYHRAYIQADHLDSLHQNLSHLLFHAPEKQVFRLCLCIGLWVYLVMSFLRNWTSFSPPWSKKWNTIYSAITTRIELMKLLILYVILRLFGEQVLNKRKRLILKVFPYRISNWHQIHHFT